VQYAADQQCASMHRALLREAADAPAGPMFVAGMPHTNAAGTAVMLHFGIDRMLAPPFHEPARQLFALRPLAELPGVVRIEQPGEPPHSLPLGSTWWFPDTTALGRALPLAPLPELPVAGDDDGVFDLTTPRLDQLLGIAETAFVTGAPTFGLATPGVRAQAYRVTLFTANGYLSCICWNHAAEGAADGSIDMLRFFAGDRSNTFDPSPARLSTRVPSFIGDALAVPTTIDLVPDFPTLFEAGTVDLATLRFTPTHRARRLITFRFDRGYPAWVRRAQGTERD
jgi:hypothetical protein